MEKGFIKRYLKYDDTLTWLDMCSSSHGGHFHRSHFIDFSSFIYILLGGMITGLFFMIIEKCSHILSTTREKVKEIVFLIMVRVTA